MKIEEHATELGGLVLNFHCLEFIIRGFLQNLPGARPTGLTHGVSFYTATVGSELPENDITNYDSLGTLIDRYNHEATARGLGKAIDPSLVIIRDAIAHGRVSAEDHHAPLRLIKFDRPVKGRVRVTVNETMTKDWFKTQQRRVNSAIEAVHKSYQAIPKPG